MSFSHCPRCHEQVSLPVAASPQARVRCPLCQEEYLLEDALRKLPPMLILVDDLSADGAPQAGGSWQSFEPAVIDTDDGEEFSFQPLEAASPSAPSAFAVSDTRPAPAPGSISTRTSRRPKKAKGSPIKSIIGMVLGGVLAFPIAQLILWNLPGEWKRDLGFGPKVASLGSWISWAVPEKFRGNSGSQSSQPIELPDFTASAVARNETGAAASNQNPSSSIPDFQFGETEGTPAADNTTDNKQGQGKKGKGKKQTDAAKAESTDQTELDATAQSSPTESTAPEQSSTTPLEVPALTIDPLQTVELPGTETAPNSKKRPSTSEPTEAPEPTLTIDPPSAVASAAVGVVRDTPVVSGEQLAASFTAAQDADKALGGADPSDAAAIRPLQRDFYIALATLGHSLAFANQADEQSAQPLAGTVELLSTIGQKADKLDLINSGGPNWLDRKRPTEGVVLHGTIQSVTPQGELFLTKVQLASAGDREVTLVSRSDPTEQFEPNRRLLILGSIVTDPAKNLSGFEGDDKQVVLDGFHYVLPAE